MEGSEISFIQINNSDNDVLNMIHHLELSQSLLHFELFAY